MTRWLGALGIIGALAWAGAANAHVDVEANPPVAGATNAVVTFSAEAESTNAGITSVRVALPAGLSNSDVTLDQAPTGWQLSATSDGYTVGGAALPTGEDAVHSIVVTRLPDASALAFKTLVNYADGQVDRWIEEPSTANPNPDNPAPVLQLRPGSSPAAPTVTTSPGPSPTPTPATAPAVTTPAPAASDAGDGGSGWVWWVIAAAALIALGAGSWFAITKRR